LETGQKGTLFPKGFRVVFHRISSISYGFLVKLDCSKTGAGGNTCNKLPMSSS
jgi:hypothetical protein